MRKLRFQVLNYLLGLGVLGDIFADTKDLEKEIDDLEEQSIVNNTEQHRSILNQKKAALTRHLKIQQAYWKQTATFNGLKKEI